MAIIEYSATVSFNAHSARPRRQTWGGLFLRAEGDLMANCTALISRFDDLVDRRAVAIESVSLMTEMLESLCETAGSEFVDSGPQKIKMARCLYWKTDIPAGTIKIFLGPEIMAGRMLSGPQGGLMGEFPSGANCELCDWEIQATSRTQIQSFKRNSRSRHSAYPKVCKGCIQEKKLLDAAKWKEWGVEREAEWQLKHERWKIRLNELRSMSYSKYLQSAEWQNRRKGALRRAGYRCQLCSNKDSILDVHHRTYKRLGDEHNSDLIVLCRECHDIFHTHRGLT